MSGLQDRLTPEQVEEFGRELDALRQRSVDDLGQTVVINGMSAFQSERTHQQVRDRENRRY